MTIRFRENLIIMESRPSLLLKNVLLPGGRTGDIAIMDRKVSHIGAGQDAESVIDCTGLLVLPAAVDMHVHMRGGTQSAKEDWTSGSKSALAGGVTVVVDQPNTIPPLTTPELFSARVCEAKTQSFCNFAINSGVTPNTSLGAMWRGGAIAFGEIFCAPSSYGEAVSGHELTEILGDIAELDALATVHAESVRDGPDTSLASHDALRSPEGELRAVQAVRHSNTRSCRLHFCHMSTAWAIDVAAGTVEVTPHHLLLSREQFSPDDTRVKVNPPLRNERERKGLLAQWKQIDVIASDHAPHTTAEKGLPFPDAPAGIPGVETMVPLLLAEVLNRTISLPDVILKTSQAPARLVGIPPAGFTPGARGDFALYPKTAVRIDPDMLHNRCGWTPFEGRMAVFPSIVIRDGAVTYRDGEFFRREPVWFAGNGYVPP
jgi:dihydroorotase